MKYEGQTVALFLLAVPLELNLLLLLMYKRLTLIELIFIPGLKNLTKSTTKWKGKNIMVMLVSTVVIINAVAKWPVTSQGFQNTKWPAVRYFQ